MTLAPDVPYSVGDYAFGGYVAGVIDTTKGNIIAADASQTGARYLLVVAPASLETYGLKWATSNQYPTAAKTRWDGLTATNAMASTTFPAANYCAGLSYPSDKGSKWYLPALDELEVVYRNLKPDTAGNLVGSTDGSAFPATTVNYGTNPSSDPTGAAYTTTSPGQTTATAFRSGGSQALATGTHWSSSVANVGESWQQTFGIGSFSNGQQAHDTQSGGTYVRPVRRVLVSDLNTAPNAPSLTSPANNATIDRGITQRFAWNFSDPDAGDSQSKYDLQYRLTGGTWTTVSGTTPNTYRDFAASTFAAGNYEWQVRTYDAQGVVGPWSASSFFTAADAPAPAAITAPTSGATVSSTATLTWSAPNQTDYEWRRVKDNAGSPDTSTIYQDSGDVVSSTTRSVTLTFDTNNRYEHLQVRIKYNGLWSAWSSIRVLVSYTQAAPATVSKTTDDATGSILIHITNPAPGAGQPAASYNEVWIDDGNGLERKATMIPPNTDWRFWTPVALRDYDGNVVVKTVGDNGTVVESAA